MHPRVEGARVAGAVEQADCDRGQEQQHDDGSGLAAASQRRPQGAADQRQPDT